MFVCSVCPGGQTKFVEGKQFLDHFSFYHSLSTAKGSMMCCYTSCIGRTYKYNSFRRHVMGHNKTDGALPG